MKSTVSRAILERLPVYLDFLKNYGGDTVSSSTVAKELHLGVVQVRKDLSLVSGAGRPKIGYRTAELISHIEHFMGFDSPSEAVIVGAGKIGMALLNYDGFDSVGVHIGAAFDIKETSTPANGKKVYLIDKFPSYCKEHNVKLGIITVPKESAQNVCDLMLGIGISAIWNFSPATLSVPEGVAVINEKLAISLSQLRQHI